VTISVRMTMRTGAVFRIVRDRFRRWRGRLVCAELPLVFLSGTDYGPHVDSRRAGRGGRHSRSGGRLMLCPLRGCLAAGAYRFLRRWRLKALAADGTVDFDLVHHPTPAQADSAR
ncbi:MAG: hypothetical protein JWO42_2467, partial [Chloroflexi bacterium]|nr:hypothetical protein [Chloroflexota bacterium]